MRPSQVQRPLLAGLLHSLWGVSSPTIAWGDADQAPVYSHLWAVGRNPFGLLGAGHRMSFVQRDAAQRNLVHTYLAATTSAVRSPTFALRTLARTRTDGSRRRESGAGELTRSGTAHALKPPPMRPADAIVEHHTVCCATQCFGC
jgi:hypothetical protein